MWSSHDFNLTPAPPPFIFIPLLVCELGCTLNLVRHILTRPLTDILTNLLKYKFSDIHYIYKVLWNIEMAWIHSILFYKIVLAVFWNILEILRKKKKKTFSMEDYNTWPYHHDKVKKLRIFIKQKHFWLISKIKVSSREIAPLMGESLFVLS